MPIHTVRPNYVVVDDILSPIKQAVSKLHTATASVQKRIRRKRQARRIKANEKKKILKQQNIQYNNASRLNRITQTINAQIVSSDSDSETDTVMSEPTVSHNKSNIQHTNTTKSNTDISASDINTDTDTDGTVQPSKLSFQWLVPSTTILTNTTTAITNTTKSIFTSIMQPWLRTTELQSTVQKLQDEMNALKSQLAAQQSTTTSIPTAPSNNVPAAPTMNTPTAPPMAPPLAPSAPPMAPGMSMPPPPPPPISFAAPSSTRGQMLANIANAKLKKNDTTAVQGSKQATLADISASDLLNAATRLRKPTDTPQQRTTRSGSQPTIDLADIMNVRLRSTPARNTRQSIGAEKDGPIVSLLDLQSIKLKKSVDKSPGGTPRIAKRNASFSNEVENTPGSFLFQQLTKKFKADPRSQLYQAHNVVLDTPWTQAKPKSPAARRVSMKSPIAENVKSPRTIKSPANTVKSPRQVLSNVTNTTQTSADISANSERISNKSHGVVKTGSRRTSANNKSPKLLA